MKTIYISDDDENDGLTREAAVHSWKRATKLAGGDAEIDMRDASRERINEEIKRSRRPSQRRRGGLAMLLVTMLRRELI